MWASTTCFTSLGIWSVHLPTQILCPIELLKSFNDNKAVSTKLNSVQFNVTLLTLKLWPLHQNTKIDTICLAWQLTQQKQKCCIWRILNFDFIDIKVSKNNVAMTYLCTSSTYTTMTFVFQHTIQWLFSDLFQRTILWLLNDFVSEIQLKVNFTSMWTLVYKNNVNNASKHKSTQTYQYEN